MGRDGSVIGVDRSAEAIALAKRRAADVGLANVSFVTQDLQDLATEARFDAIIGRLVLMYFPEPDALLRRLLELLVPGGIVAFHEFDVTCRDQRAARAAARALGRACMRGVALCACQSAHGPAVGADLPRGAAAGAAHDRACTRRDRGRCCEPSISSPESHARCCR